MIYALWLDISETDAVGFDIIEIYDLDYGESELVGISSMVSDLIF